MGSEIHKGDHFQKYLKNTPWYLLSSLTTKAMGFLLIPLYTNYLSPEAFGTLSTLEALGRVLPVFLSLYLDSAFNRYYYQEKNISKGNVTLLFSTHFWFLIPWGITVSICAFVGMPYLLTDLSMMSMWPVIIVILTQLLNQLAVMATLIWQANLLAKKLAIFQIIMSFLTAVLTIYLIAIKGDGWESRIYAVGFLSIVQFLILVSIAKAKGWLGFVFKTSVLKRSLSFSLPLLPNIAAGWIAMFSDRLILAHFGQLEGVGLYSVAAQVAILIYVINDALTKVQGPISMSGLVSNKVEAKSKMSEFVTGYVSIIGFSYSLLLIFSRELFYIFTSSAYHEAYKLVVILALVYVFSGLYRVFTVILSFHNKTWLISIAAFIQAITNIVFNFIFIPEFGMYAAAYSTLFSMILYSVFIIFWAQRLDRINIDYFLFIKVIFFTMCVFTSLTLLNELLPVSLWLFVIKVLMFFLVSIFYINMKTNEFVKNMLLKKIKRY